MNDVCTTNALMRPATIVLENRAIARDTFLLDRKSTRLNSSH